MVAVCTGVARVAVGMEWVWAQERARRITYPPPRPSATNCHPRRPHRPAQAPEISCSLTGPTYRPITCSRPMQETRNSPKDGGKLRIIFPFFSLSSLSFNVFYVCDSFEDEAERHEKSVWALSVCRDVPF